MKLRGPQLALCVFVIACHPRIAPPSGPLEAASTQASAPGASARELALAGFAAELLRGDSALAKRHYDAAVALNPADPYALYGELLWAQRSGHPETAVALALDLCEHNPQHALAAAAARVVLDHAGTSVALDDRLLRRVPALLNAGRVPGDAAHLLRGTLATISGQRGDFAAQDAALAGMGMPTGYSVLGPFSPYHVLEFDAPLPPEKDGSLAGAFHGPGGALVPRTLLFPDSRFSLAGSGARGDMYLLAVDVDVAASALYVLRAVSSSSYKASLDGVPLLERRAFEEASTTVGAAGVRLGRGTHRLLVKLARGDGSGTFGVALLRADGGPSDLAFRPATGAAPAPGSLARVDAEDVYPDAASVDRALAPEVGGLLASYLAAYDGMGRDRDGVKALVARTELAVPAVSSSPAWTELRAALALADHTVAAKVAQGRATRDLEASLEKNPRSVSALLELAQLALEEGRPLEASELVGRARTAATPMGARVPLMQAHVFVALGADAQADQSLGEALRLEPGLCEATQLRYDLARRREAVALADELLAALASCPGAISRTAEHLKVRGNLAGAIGQYQKLFAREPANTALGTTLVPLYLAEHRFEEATALLRGLSRLWPRNPALLKHQADVASFGGKPEEALRLREAALELDNSDLSLRRQVDRARTGQEPLEAYDVPGSAAIQAYEAEPRDESAPSAFVLDLAAMRAFPDGSMLDRIHIIQKALDQNGVQELGEVALPAGAQVLALRTLKPDGTALEPENIADKETVSMPDVQVGDYVEQLFLDAHPSRGALEPGFTAPNFYFQVAQSPNHWSTYTVLAPRGSGMTVDAHNMPSPPPSEEGELEVYRYAARHVPPFIPEPGSPPSATEFLPFVSVGAGSLGNAALAAAYADGSLDRGQRTQEVTAFAQGAAQGKTGTEAVRAVYAAVMHKLQGRDAGLSMSAAASVAQDRGSRLWLLKAALEAVGFPTRLAVVRTFGVDPAPYRFPNEQLFQYVCLRTALPNGQYLWLDPLVRFAPFGQLPEQATGGREAYLLPEPGRPYQTTRTPDAKPPLGKQVKLDLKLSTDGSLTGTGEEDYVGFDAVQVAEALDQLAPDARDQALQRALSRYFGGADLAQVTLDMTRDVGAPLVVRYHFKAPRFARVEGERLVLGALSYPLQLGQRFVQLGSRRTPLFIDGTERVKTHVTLELPPGFSVSGVQAHLEEAGPYGHFVRSEAQAGPVFTIDEAFELDMARVPVAAYGDFAQFAGQVDLAQTRDLVAEKKEARATAPGP